MPRLSRVALAAVLALVATLVGSYQWAYPDTQVNTETMFVFDGDLVVVTKSEPSRVYRFNGPLLPFLVNVPTYVGTLPAESKTLWHLQHR